jgi:hypothetical protein
MVIDVESMIGDAAVRFAKNGEGVGAVLVSVVNVE